MKLLLMFPCKQANAVGETVQKTKQNKEEKTKNEMKTLWRLRESSLTIVVVKNFWYIICNTNNVATKEFGNTECIDQLS